jgi:subtilisin family serine protease
MMPTLRQIFRCLAPRRRAGGALACMAAALACWLCADPAQAQLGLPRGGLPSLPVALPPVVPATLETATDAVGSTARTALRATRVAEMLRAHRSELETDPNGNAIVRSQLLAIGPSAEALATATSEGFKVLRTQQLAGLDLTVVTLQIPANVRIVRALRRLRALDPAGQYDFDHVYLESGEPAASNASSQLKNATAAAPIAASGAARSARVGLIDGGVDTAHPALQSSEVLHWGCDAHSIPTRHGTAVASLLVGNSAVFRGAAPGARLYAADVYCGEATGGNAETLAQAFAWMAHEQVPVVNVSLVGPPNKLLEAVVKALLARGSIIVAAVGNDGPAAPPLYPASYTGVIGVTAVDAHRHVLPEAGRGPQVYVSAPGADLNAATLAGRYEAVRGTSYAAPLVAGLLALSLAAPDPTQAREAMQRIAAEAKDLGERGYDTTYGHGLVPDALRVRDVVDITTKKSTGPMEERNSSQRH